MNSFDKDDIKQAIREVLLSDEFMTAFAAAWMKTPLPLAMHFDGKDGERIRSLADYPFGEPAKEHPTLGVNQPMTSSEPTKAQQLAERTMKAIWQANEGGEVITERKYREVTEADIGERIEVTDDWSISKGIVWHERTLLRIVPENQPYMTDNGAVWHFARIEVKDDPT